MTKIIEKEKERIRKVARLLHDGAKRVRILRSIDWSPPVKQDFFAKNAKELPEINYPSFDAKPTIDIIREARRMIIPISPIDQWLERQATASLRRTYRSVALHSRYLTGTCTEYSRHY
ncbi:MAG: hypothetical protein CG439_1018 [Methylococcaceae bacterium NSP1-2]|nr:MAG: hypothetical protein CG439_1018 [Methylococcaceae bacterium NSP1-2]